MDEKYKIIYSPLFYKDLEMITNYIKNNLKNLQAAKNLTEKVEKAIIKRSNHPKSFEKYISNKKRKNIYYRIYVKNYVIFYIVKDNIMEVRRILYGKTNFLKYLD